ncbi:hypothetical protein VTI28DRAFT_329 [Corynascus sepedonium]
MAMKLESPPDLELDALIQLEMELEEDVAAELKHFVRLVRYDMIMFAKFWYQRRLKRHTHMFPILAEYAEMLLQIGEYDELIQVLDSIDYASLTALGQDSLPDIRQLFASMRVLARLRGKDLPPEVATATVTECWEYLKEAHVRMTAQGKEDLSAVQIHLVEVYLAIAVAVFTSQLPDMDVEYTNPPWASAISAPWLGFCGWYTKLKRLGRHWEAQKVQRLLLPMLQLKDALNTVILRDPFAAVAANIASSASDFDESLVLSEIVSSTTIREYLLARQDEDTSTLSEAYFGASEYLMSLLAKHSVEEVREAVNWMQRSLRTDRALRDRDLAAQKDLLFIAVKGDYWFGAERHILAMIDKLLVRGQIDPDCRDDTGRTPFSYSVTSGVPKEALPRLLATGKVNLNSRDKDGSTPLAYAVARNLLARWGADPNTKDSKGMTPLLYTARAGHVGMAQVLLEYGADPNAKDLTGRTTLSHTVGIVMGWLRYFQVPDMVKLLLDYGVNVHRRDDENRTALWYAANAAQHKAARLLLEKGAEVNAADDEGTTPLMLTARGIDRFDENRGDAVKLLLEKGAEVNAVDERGKSPLFYAVERGRTDAVQLLLENGAEVDAVDKKGRTPLFYAPSENQRDTVQLLLDHGASASLTDETGRSPLFYAAERGRTDAVQLLLENGAEVDAVDKKGRTPLSYAAESFQSDIVPLLLDHGASASLEDETGRNPLAYAMRHRFEKIHNLLRGANLPRID